MESGRCRRSGRVFAFALLYLMGVFVKGKSQERWLGQSPVEEMDVWHLWLVVVGSLGFMGFLWVLGWFYWVWRGESRCEIAGENVVNSW